MPKQALLRSVWNKFLDLLLEDANFAELQEAHARAIGISRLGEQLWTALENSENTADGWAYPLDIYVDDDGSSLFCIVAQSGKLYRIPMTVENDNLSLGEWLQVTEVYEPVQQSKFTIQRQKDGSHRWLFVAATSVLNRVGEIDSSELFDNFILRAEESGKYPRVDFYHLGESDPETWEFGTADYLVRDGVCYIASGTFDEDHPLAKATIRAYATDPDVWGCSIEFYAWAEAELIAVEPEVRVPMYRDGENTRISIVLEEDAAGWFTRVGISQEKTRMKRDVLDKLKLLFGTDEKGLEEFIEEFADGVDATNRTVKSERMVYRASKRARKPEKEEDVSDDETEDAEDPKNSSSNLPTHDPNKDGTDATGTTEDLTSDEDDEEEDLEFELTEETVQQIAEVVIENKALQDLVSANRQIVQTLEQVQQSLAEITVQNEKLVSRSKRLQGRIEALEADDGEKQQEWLEDLPARRQAKVTYRARVSRQELEDDEEYEDEDLSYDDIASETLSKLPSY